ncbi:hypothetical protein [Acetobacter sp.]|uniref:hypothetical protein n=1 Tax=Acetobacter sp. TaxID=440 RepID=UPI0039E9AA9C
MCRSKAVRPYPQSKGEPLRIQLVDAKRDTNIRPVIGLEQVVFAQHRQNRVAVENKILNVFRAVFERCRTQQVEQNAPAETNKAQITLNMLRQWGACQDGKSWFSNKFPQGAEYGETMTALYADKKYTDAQWLAQNAFDKAFSKEIVISDVNSLIALTKDIGEAEEASGDYDWIGSSGDGARIGSSGYGTRIGSSGDGAQIGSSGDGAQIGSSGDGTRIGSSGYGTRIGSSGDDAQIGSSG